MPIVKNLKMNEVYSWKVMAEAYPDSWLFLSNITEDKGGAIVSGRLLAVSKDNDDISSALKIVKSYNKPYGCYRSTYDSNVVDLWC